MTSILIWKSDTPNTSKNCIKYYLGSNWVLEDNEYSSKSYMVIDQIVIPGLNDLVNIQSGVNLQQATPIIALNIKKMPYDWVGTELLEVTNIPYEQIKSDTYGTLEKIGEWMRFTSKNTNMFNKDLLQNELVNIKRWMSNEVIQYDNLKQIQCNLHNFIMRYNHSK